MDRTSEPLSSTISAELSSASTPLSRRHVLSGVGAGTAVLPMLALSSNGAQAQTGVSGPQSRTSAHTKNKRLVADFLKAMETGDAGAVLAKYCHQDCKFEVFHPFNTLDTLQTAASKFWTPLKKSFPNYENRIAYTIGGTYEGRDMVSTWGHVMGTFDEPWLGIPPTRGLAFLRFGFAAIVRDGRIAKAYVLLDIVDVMRQAGFYPFREMPGTPEAWPFPPQGVGATADAYDPARGANSLRIVREMQTKLPTPEEVKVVTEQPVKYSPNWHVNMNWYGPAGIGSSRARRGFRDFHGSLFLQAFPDRFFPDREPGGAQDAAGHYMRLGDGYFACTGGWPSVRATHLGGEWLGLPPTGRKVEMRVADWYRVDETDKIIDNWVMIDVPHIVHQMGLDLFHDLTFRIDRSIPRYPLTKGKTG